MPVLNEAAVRTAERALRAWKPGVALLFHGQTGTGKSTGALLVAERCGYEPLVVEADAIATPADAKKRDGATTVDALVEAVAQRGFTGKRKALIVDAVELSRAAELVRLAAESPVPVIFIALELYERRLAALRNVCVPIAFLSVPAAAIRAVTGADAQTAREARGDARAAAIDHAHGIVSERDYDAAIFDVIRVIFKTDDLATARDAFERAHEPDEVVRWLAENVAAEYTDPGERASAYDWLSKADIMRRRVERHAHTFAYGGVALSKTKPRPGFVRYQKPWFAWERNGAAAKLAPHVHTSVRKARAYRALVRSFVNDAAFLAALGLTPAEARGF